MSIDFNWHDEEHTIVRIDMHRDAQWDEYHPVIDKVVEALKNTSHRIDVILNDQNDRMPPGNPMPHIRVTAQKLIVHQNMGVIVAVSGRRTNKLVEMFVPLVYRVYGIDTRIIGDYVSTLEEAEASIARERAEASAV